MRGFAAAFFCFVIGVWSGPASARDFMKEIDLYFRQAKLDSAMAAAQSFVVACPDSVDAQGFLGMVYAEVGRADDAIAAFQQVIRLKPTTLRGYRDLAMLYAGIGRGQKALQVLNDGLQQTSGSPFLLMERATLHGNLGNPKAAIADFETVIGKQPDNIEAYHSLALLYAALKDFDRALAVLGRGLTRNTGNARLLVDRGGIYHALGKTAEAFQSYEQAARSAPDDPQVYRAMGFMAAEVDSLDRAQRAWEKVLSLDPNDVEVRDALGQLYLSRGDLSAAQQAYEKLVEMAPRAAAPHFALGQIYGQKGDMVRAKAEFQACIDLSPEWLEPYKGLALVYMNEEDLDSAMAVYREALAVDSTSSEIHNNIGFIHTLNRDFDRAKASYRKAMAFSSDKATLTEAQGNLEIVASIQAGKLRVRHILVKTEAEAQEVLQKLRAGADFGEMARDHSIDKSTAAVGGYLGFFSPGDLHPAFEEAVLKLKVGEMSEVVQTPVGYHIILRIN